MKINISFSRGRRLVFTVLSCGVFLISGCSAFQFKVPTSLETGSKQYSVKGRTGFNVDRELEYASYQLGVIEAAAMSKQERSEGLDLGTKCQRPSKLKFTAKTANSWAVSCTAKAEHSRNVSKGVLDRYVESLGCDFIPKEGKTWRLNTRSEDLGPLAGTISGDEVDLQVETQGRFRTGVVIRSKGLAVAAASFMRPGKIWIAKTLYGTEAQAAASVLGILMLYQETLTASVNCRISGDG